MSPGHMAHLERTIRTYVALVAKVQWVIAIGEVDGKIFEPELGEAFACIRAAQELSWGGEGQSGLSGLTREIEAAGFYEDEEENGGSGVKETGGGLK